MFANIHYENNTYNSIDPKAVKEELLVSENGVVGSIRVVPNG